MIRWKVRTALGHDIRVDVEHRACTNVERDTSRNVKLRELAWPIGRPITSRSASTIASRNMNAGDRPMDRNVSAKRR